MGRQKLLVSLVTVVVDRELLSENPRILPTEFIQSNSFEELLGSSIHKSKGKRSTPPDSKSL